jgi:hypothetical protein
MAVSRINEAGLNVNQYGNRNLVINGAQNIAQRGTSLTSQNTSHFVTDRFEPTLSSYGVWTTEQSSDAPDGFSKSLKMTCTTADTSPGSTDFCRISYVPEAQDLQHLNFGSSAAKTTTVSFWVKSNVVATYVFWMYQPDNANTRQINRLFTVDSADTWEYKTLTIEGDTSGTINNDNGSGMLIGWILSSGTGYTSGTRPTNWTNHTAADRWVGLTADVGGTVNNYFQITGVQWEVGDTATDFEHRTFGDELAKCQRYCLVLDSGIVYGTYGYVGFAENSTTAKVIMSFPVHMRSAPSLTRSGSFTYDGASGNPSISSTGAVNTPYCSRIEDTVSGATQGQGLILINNNDSDAKLTFDAEL